jgi:hypothetical protein
MTINKIAWKLLQATRDTNRVAKFIRAYVDKPDEETCAKLALACKAVQAYPNLKWMQTDASLEVYKTKEDPERIHGVVKDIITGTKEEICVIKDSPLSLPDSDGLYESLKSDAL